MNTLTIDGKKHKVNDAVSNLVLMISKERDELRELTENEDVNYRDFYGENRISLLQYESLRRNFSLMVDNVLGEDYYNMAMDVYDCDTACCEDITRKANRTIWQHLFNR